MFVQIEKSSEQSSNSIVLMILHRGHGFGFAALTEDLAPLIVPEMRS